MQRPDIDPNKIIFAHRVIAAVVGIGFASIGAFVLGSLWLEPFGRMHTPIFFRLFGSAIAVVFVVFGGAMAVGAIWSRPLNALTRRSRNSGHRNQNVGYKCPTCGAGLSDNADVSPSGDVKCDYCRTWFNVHR